MTMTLELPDDVLQRLTALAKQQHKTPEAVALALLDEKLQKATEDDHRARVQAAGNYVQGKNAELYRRLA